jgi:LacI family transcriptional regulator
MATTLSKIAEEVGVDRSLVSRVLSGDPKARLSDAKREQILSVSKALGYRPNRVGRSLRTGRTSVIGVLTPDVTNPFHSVLFRGVEAVATAAGYDTILCNTDDNAERFKDVVTTLSEGHVDGLIVATALSEDPAIEWLSDVDLPYLLVNRRRRDKSDPWIGPDDFQTGWIGGTHLLELGHTRIAVLIGVLNHDNLRLRMDGFRAAVEKHRGKSIQWTVKGDLATRLEARNYVMELLELPPHLRPTAIFATQTHTTDGALHAIYRSGMRIPDDISLIGYSANAEPEVTCIHAPVDQIGRLAAQHLIDNLQRTDRTKPIDVNITVPVSLMDCGTTGPAPTAAPKATVSPEPVAPRKARDRRSAR